MLASYDDRADDLSSENVLRQCLRLISVMPQLAVYGYHSYNHYLRGRSFYIHNPRDELSEADNLLRMLRSDKQYSELEASVLDLCIALHMEHGGLVTTPPSPPVSLHRRAAIRILFLPQRWVP